MTTTTAIATSKAQIIAAISPRAKTSDTRAVIQLELWSNAAQVYTTVIVTVDALELAEVCGLVTDLGRRLLGPSVVKGQALYCPI